METHNPLVVLLVTGKSKIVFVFQIKL